jgi:hypothetical protein
MQSSERLRAGVLAAMAIALVGAIACGACKVGPLSPGGSCEELGKHERLTSSCDGDVLVTATETCDNTTGDYVSHDPMRYTCPSPMTCRDVASADSECVVLCASNHDCAAGSYCGGAGDARYAQHCMPIPDHQVCDPAKSPGDPSSCSPGLACLPVSTSDVDGAAPDDGGGDGASGPDGNAPDASDAGTGDIRYECQRS